MSVQAEPEPKVGILEHFSARPDMTISILLIFITKTQILFILTKTIIFAHGKW
jgi:hypothetical protein